MAFKSLRKQAGEDSSMRWASVFIPPLGHSGSIFFSRHHPLWFRVHPIEGFHLVRESAWVPVSMRLMDPSHMFYFVKEWRPVPRGPSPFHISKLFPTRFHHHWNQTTVYYFRASLETSTKKFYASPLKQSKFTKLCVRYEKKISNRWDNLLGSRKKSLWSLGASKRIKKSQDSENRR